MTTSITTNHPCLITSVELDCSWDWFSASEKIPRSGVGGGWGLGRSWMGNKAIELLWMVWFGSMGLLLFFLFPSQNEPGTNGQFPKPLPDDSMGKKKPQLNSTRRERKKALWWPPLWEYCKLCFLRPWESHTKLEPVGMENRAWFPRERTCQMHSSITRSLKQSPWCTAQKVRHWQNTDRTKKKNLDITAMRTSFVGCKFVFHSSHLHCQ